MAHEDSLAGAGAPWFGLVRELLGTDARNLFAGCVLARPGAADQQAHLDGAHLFHATHRTGSPACPAHCINVFVPLVDVTDENGPTEFWLGSHTDPSRAREILQAAVAGKEVPGVPRLRIAGSVRDAIVFDYRVVHRGCANKSDQEDRPVMYFTFARFWWFITFIVGQ